MRELPEKEDSPLQAAVHCIPSTGNWRWDSDGVFCVAKVEDSMLHPMVMNGITATLQHDDRLCQTGNDREMGMGSHLRKNEGMYVCVTEIEIQSRLLTDIEAKHWVQCVVAEVNASKQTTAGFG